MAVCKHCGALMDDDVKFCPNCGKQNTEQADESYLDNLLNALVSNAPEKRSLPKKSAKTEQEESAEEFSTESRTEPEDSFAMDTLQEPVFDPFADEPALMTKEEFFEPDEELETNMYNIFSEFEEDDIDSMIARELNEELPEEDRTEETVPEEPVPEEFIPEERMAFTEDNSQEERMNFEDVFSMDESTEDSAFPLEDNQLPEDFDLPEETPDFDFSDTTAEEPDDIFALDDSGFEDFSPADFGLDDSGSFPEENGLDDSWLPTLEEDNINGLNSSELEGLDALLQGFGEDEIEEIDTTEHRYDDNSLEALLASELAAADGDSFKKKKEGSWWQRLFGNVPVDPSKIKPEPTAEELAAAKAKKDEEKKKAADEKKVAAEAKKEAAKAAKEEKEKQKLLKKEEKQKKKLEQAKELLEDMQATRINRVGASIVFAAFALLAVAIIFGGKAVSYSVNVKNAEKDFNNALNFDEKYYTKAYERIYGMELKEDEQELGDKITTVMFVNKELSSYKNHMKLKNYDDALHSLLKGLNRYGKYFEHSVEKGFSEDMDYVRSRILEELEGTFDISEDEAEVLRSMLEASLYSDDASLNYSMMLQNIVNATEFETK